jgi:hypothetical protein
MGQYGEDPLLLNYSVHNTNLGLLHTLSLPPILHGEGGPKSFCHTKGSQRATLHFDGVRAESAQ